MSEAELAEKYRLDNWNEDQKDTEIAKLRAELATLTEYAERLRGALAKIQKEPMVLESNLMVEELLNSAPADFVEIAKAKQAVAHQIVEFRNECDRYFAGDLRVPWSVIRDDLESLCMAIDALQEAPKREGVKG